MAKKASHENVLKVKKLLTDENGNKAMVMELAEGGSLESRITQHGLSEREMKPIVRQLVAALVHFEKMEIAHLDIKPENILFDKNDKPMFCDFGLALNFSDFGEMKKMNAPARGSGFFMAPEMIAQQWNNMKKADIYSFGLMVIEMLVGIKDTPAAELAEFKQSASDSLKSFVVAATQVNVQQRATAQQLLQHRWLRE